MAPFTIGWYKILSPLFPFKEAFRVNPSQTRLIKLPFFNMFERGSEFREGAFSPLSICLPSPAKKSSGLPVKKGWRGVRGEVMN